MRSSHDTANPALVEVLTSEAPSAIHWLEELGVEFTPRKRRLPARALRRCDAAAPAAGRRPHGPRDHEGAARDIRGGSRERSSRTIGCARSIPRTATGSRRSTRRRAARRSPPKPSSLRPGDAASRRRRRAASSPRTTRTRPARRRASPWPRERRPATWTRSSTTRTAAPGRRRCRATRFPRRRARTAQSCATQTARSSPTRSGPRDAVSAAIVAEVEKPARA